MRRINKAGTEKQGHRNNHDCSIQDQPSLKIWYHEGLELCRPSLNPKSHGKSVRDGNRSGIHGGRGNPSGRNIALLRKKDGRTTSGARGKGKNRARGEEKLCVFYTKKENGKRPPPPGHVLYFISNLHFAFWHLRPRWKWAPFSQCATIYASPLPLACQTNISFHEIFFPSLGAYFV